MMVRADVELTVNEPEDEDSDPVSTTGRDLADEQFRVAGGHASDRPASASSWSTGWILACHCLS